ncbi:MAG: hypothetical protein Barrevirus38_3 [Barrevirus sp.]|uniref:Treble clef zinc finger domain-containing protein n=1 Tax=Barrevirus sp. TaxID=2487763 RepID=A0A3G4ZR11_9VIRU|nr:MAG: hypothetical protein Barrevirus38_3 [Barrevirus sp.]
MSEITFHDQLITQWHPSKNGDKKFTDYQSGSNYKAWWLCNESESEYPHEWQTVINKRVQFDMGCPYCAPVTK